MQASKILAMLSFVCLILDSTAYRSIVLMLVISSIVLNAPSTASDTLKIFWFINNAKALNA